MAGEEILIGSRQAERAEAAAVEVRSTVPGARVRGDRNEAVIPGAELVALCFPFSGVEPLLSAQGEALAGKIVIDAINPLVVRKGVFGLQPVPDGSAGLMIQRLAPQARVVGAFKTISAEHLRHLSEPLHGDVFLCSDDAEAKQIVEQLVRRIPNLRPLDAGPLAATATVEGITAMLLNLNRRYKAVTSMQVVGIG